MTNEMIISESQSLYSDIDCCITELLKARTEHNSENEGKALFKMEGLMVSTLQHLACIIEQPSLPSVLADWVQDFYKKCGFAPVKEEDGFMRMYKLLHEEKPKVVNGVVHHALKSHWIVTDKNKLAAILKAFPEGAEVELFVCAKKEKNDK